MRGMGRERERRGGGGRRDALTTWFRHNIMHASWCNNDQDQLCNKTILYVSHAPNNKLEGAVEYPCHSSDKLLTQLSSTNTSANQLLVQRV